MSIRYKFKNTTQYDTIFFAGNSISLGDFKREVIQQKHLTTDDDLKVVVAETKQEYNKLDDQIPKNASVIVSRVPRTPKTKKSNISKRVLTPKTNCMNVENPKINDGICKTILDLSKLNISEEKKIEVMMKQSTSVYSPSKYIKGSHQALPANYRCNKCHLAGHWIKDCPIVLPNIAKISKGKAGIPRSFLNAESQNKENTFPQRQEVDRKLPDAPNELLCSICEHLLVDAVMISCCGRTFCDCCIRSKLLESRKNECPECLEADIDLDSLIPNRYMRKAVNTFKTERKLTETSSKMKR